MNSKITTLVVTIFLLSIKTLSPMAPHKTPITILNDSQLHHQRRLAAGIIATQDVEKLFRTDIENDQASTRQYFSEQYAAQQAPIERDIIIKRQQQAEQPRRALYYRQELSNSEQRYHQQLHKTPQRATKEDCRILAYRRQIEELPTPSGQPVDPRTTVDPTLTAKLRNLVAQYSMDDYYVIKAKELKIDEKTTEKMRLFFIQEAQSRIDKTYARIQTVARELPADMRPNTYDELTTIAWLRDFLKANAHRRRLEHNQELQRKLLEAIAATSSSECAAASTNSVNM